MLGELDGSTTKLAVTLGVVGIVAGRGAVERVTVKVGGIVDEKVTDAGEKGSVHNGRKTQAIVERNGQAGDDWCVGVRAAVARKDDGDFVALRDQRFGESFDDVGETAG